MINMIWREVNLLMFLFDYDIVPNSCNLKVEKSNIRIFNKNIQKDMDLKYEQLLSVEFSEIDVFLLQHTSGHVRPVSVHIRVSYRNVTPSIQNFTS